jgi:hypothetical protein
MTLAGVLGCAAATRATNAHATWRDALFEFFKLEVQMSHRPTLRAVQR